MVLGLYLWLGTTWIYNRVFGWGLERAGLGWTRPYGCLDGIRGELSWLQKEYSREMRVGSVR